MLAYFQDIDSNKVEIKSPHTILKEFGISVREPISLNMVWDNKLSSLHVSYRMTETHFIVDLQYYPFSLKRRHINRKS